MIVPIEEVSGVIILKWVSKDFWKLLIAKDVLRKKIEKESDEILSHLSISVNWERERGKSRRGSPLPVLDKISNETVNTAPLCYIICFILLYFACHISSIVCPTKQCSIEIHPDFLGQERNNIQDFYPRSISGNKIHFRFRFQCSFRWAS